MGEAILMSEVLVPPCHGQPALSIDPILGTGFGQGALGRRKELRLCQAPSARARDALS